MFPNIFKNNLSILTSFFSLIPILYSLKRSHNLSPSIRSIVLPFEGSCPSSIASLVNRLVVIKIPLST
jgi:hypothetical protein